MYFVSGDERDCDLCGNKASIIFNTSIYNRYIKFVDSVQTE